MVRHLQIAKGGHIGGVDGGLRWSALLARENGCLCLQDACKQRRVLLDESDHPGAGTGTIGLPRLQS